MVWFLLTWRFVCCPREREVGGPQELELGGCKGTPPQEWPGLGRALEM